VTRNRPNRYAQQEIVPGIQKTSMFDSFNFPNDFDNAV
jgi:hypothetical protein